MEQQTTDHGPAGPADPEQATDAAPASGAGATGRTGDDAGQAAAEPETGPETEPEAEQETEPEAEQETEPESESGDRPRRSGAARLEEEGEVAADYLEELLDIADLDGDIDIDVENGRAVVSILADSVAERQLRRLVGGQGEVLEALQELTRLAVQTSTGERSRLMLDVARHRAARRRELEDVATRAAREVERTGEPVRLEPMTPFERKVVHDAVAAAGLESESDGEEPQRRVVVRARG